MSKILSISAIVHDCGIAYIEDGEIKYVFEEERFKRLKGIFNQFSFPELSLQALEDLTGITPFDDDVIVVMPKPVVCGLDYIERILDKKKIHLYDHHYSHACVAYYLSGFSPSDETLVFTYDGGDGNNITAETLGPEELDIIKNQNLPYRKLFISEEEYIDILTSSKQNDESIPTQLWIPENCWLKNPERNKINVGSAVYLGNHNSLIEQSQAVDFDSIASLWQSFCGLNGMFGGKDEGKIVGLAAQGSFNGDMYDSLGKYFEFDGDLRWKYYFECEEYFASLDLNNSEIKKDASYMLQYLTENYFLSVVQHFKKKHPSATKLALSGGLFSNVKVNQKINELSEFDEIFIAPGMTDGGLALGAAIAKSKDLGEFSIRSVDNVFWGNPTNEVDAPVGIQKKHFSADEIAAYLSEGKVVGIFSNRREWGPRALGGTSIMFDPRRSDAQEYVNSRLNRNDIMPFAPVVMDGFESLPFHCYKSKYASQFMTICYDVKDEWVDRIPGVINKFDNTSRIQIAKEGNTPFYPILKSFLDLTGIPVLMNTSFNIHGEPIINKTEEAFNHLTNGVIDLLVVNDSVYYKVEFDESIFEV